MALTAASGTSAVPAETLASGVPTWVEPSRWSPCPSALTHPTFNGQRASCSSHERGPPEATLDAHTKIIGRRSLPAGPPAPIQTLSGPRARAKSALRGLTCGYGGQRPRSSLLSHRCALHLHGEHLTRAQVRATWRSVSRCDGRSRHRVAAPLRQHPSRSTACLTTLHEPWLLPALARSRQRHA